MEKEDKLVQSFLDHVTQVKEIDYVSEVDKRMNEVQEELRALREQKAKLETEELVKSFEENKYYRLDDRCCCETYYFQYSASNFQVQDMTGTVGYDGENKIVIHHGLKVFATRASFAAGMFHTAYISLSEFGRMELKEISKEAFERECNEIVEYVKRELPKR